MVVDLRSDTVTKPTPAMLAAMAAAEVGDDVYEEDPSVLALEARVAALLGLEKALFVPSGTMANQIAIHLHTSPGEGILAVEDSHCYLYEAGAAAALSGVQFSFVPFGQLANKERLAAALMADNLHYATTRLMVVENTHNRGGGRFHPPATLNVVRNFAREHNLRLHCDGARLWNASVAQQIPVAQLVGGFDSAAVCFSKGLGAPVGSCLVGSRDFIFRARKVRKRWGGGMRQAGYLACAALYAVDHHLERLAEDHERAKSFASRLQQEFATHDRRYKSHYDSDSTNMVFVETPPGQAQEISNKLRELGVLISATGPSMLRAVVHLQIGDTDIDRACEALQKAIRHSR